MQGLHFWKRKHKFECEVEVEDSNLSSLARTPNIVANIEIKISIKYVKRTKKGRSSKGSTLNIATKRSTKKKREKTERKRLAKKRNMEQIDQPSPAPTREETETEETKAPTSSFKHKATKHRSLRRTENVLPSSPRTKKEIVTSLAKYSVRIQLNKPKKSGRKPITLNDEEKNLL